MPAMAASSRNAPCHCGSGKRYKDCHGALAASPASPDRDREPRDAQLARWWRTINLDPDDVEASFHLGSHSHEHGEYVAAVIHYERALRRAPDHPDLLNGAGQSYAALGATARAEECFRAANAAAPRHAARGAFSLGVDLLLAQAHASFERGEHAEAERAWRAALVRDPGHPEVLFDVANRERERGENHAAIADYEKALERAPGHPGVTNNLGLALEAAGETERAEDCYRAVLASDPNHVDALGNLANILSAREAVRETVAVYDRLFAIRRDLPAAVWIRRAMAQNQAQDVPGAIESYREAAHLDPDDMQVQLHLGTLFIQQQAFSDGEVALRRALDLDPGNRYALSMLVHTRQQRCAWDGLGDLVTRIRAGLEDKEEPDSDFPVMPFATLAMPLSPSALLHAAQRWARTVSRGPLAPRPTVSYGTGERLRVAFATWNFRDHPTMHLSLEFWEKIDRDRLEMFAYSLRRDDDNPFQRRARRAFEHFIDVSQDSARSIAERIRKDRIGILIDRNGYTLNAREGIFPLRPAPIQVNCIGFPGTMGAGWYDYIFTDRYTVPEALQRFYGEQPLYMPHMAFPSDTTRLPSGTPPSRAACGLPDRAFVFCCFSHSYKILPDVFAIWMRLLQAVPGSVLWLLHTSGEVVSNVRRESAKAGVDPSRLVFAPIVKVAEHVARNAAADLFLDSFPYGAHTTANDALLAGLPVLTCAGETMVSRIAGSQLHAIGLPELITTSFADYEALALRLATEDKQLLSLRQRLAANRHTHALFDMARYARDFEDAMKAIWAERGALP
jgi:predicted O-linked N-acetylglucosamine transferase (SPINDLY family)